MFNIDRLPSMSSKDHLGPLTDMNRILILRPLYPIKPHLYGPILNRVSGAGGRMLRA